MFDDLFAFFHVADARGYTPASRRTGLSKATLSRRVAAIEDATSTRLIDRDARRFRLTPAGEALLPHARSMVDAGRDGLLAVQAMHERIEGTLRVACPVVLAEWAVGRLTREFMVAHPDAQITLNVSNQDVDPVGERYDIVIRPAMSRLADSSLYARRLWRAEIGLVVAPDFRRRRRWKRPEDLQDIPAVGWSSMGELPWRLTAEGAEPALVAPPIRFWSDHLLVVRQAVVEKFGIACLPLALCRAELRSGALEQVLPAWTAPSVTFHAMFVSPRDLSPTRRSYVEFLAAGLARFGDDALDPGNGAADIT